MITIDTTLEQMSHPELLAEVKRLAAQGRAVLADLLALLALLDERRLYEVDGCASLFEFCVERLLLSESQAYHRIQAARAACRFPVILERVRDGRITLTAIALLRPHLTDDNHVAVLNWAAGKRKRDVECYVRALAPLPDVRSSIRRLAPRSSTAVPMSAADKQSSSACTTPAALTDCASSISLASRASDSPAVPSSEGAFASAATPSGAELVPLLAPTPSWSSRPTAEPPARHTQVRPLSPARYSLHVTISEETHAKLRRAQDLLRHALPSADPAAIVDRALTLLVEQLERRKFAATKPKAPRAETATTGRERKAATRRHDGGTTQVTLASTSAQAPPTPRTLQQVAASLGTPQQPARSDPSRRPPAGAHGRQPRSRHIPAPVRRSVWVRDGGRCSFVGPDGVRCRETGRLEFHHQVPFAENGAATEANIWLRCTRHNQSEARRWFGDEVIEWARDGSKGRQARQL